MWEFKKGRGNGKQGFKKKGKNFNKSKTTNADNLFSGTGFCVGREGPELYMKTVERLGLYASTQFKNGVDVKKCLKKVVMVKPLPPKIEDDLMPNQKKVWEYRMSELLKIECTLESNLCNIFAVIMSLCNSDMKNQVESFTDCNEMDDNLDSLKLLATIKKIFSGGTHELNA